ncbi:MOSC domain-containing protein [Rhodothermus profundi]|uniref:MOSC domain-containing protein YiiM n=1 Tax=Rhodothermus profundi TaxID=633813 RepID=A0A1M6SRC9_9BACT|nr:MOSC domain-containing protein [Rhodothermus profundi]SHK47273.1 MOSC domain-containing protein YiiM [Rhodothermus profundi]
MDDAQLAAYIRALEALRFDPIGRVAYLVESPVPGRHLLRAALSLEVGIGCPGDHARRHAPGREVSAISLEVLRALGIPPAVPGDNLILEGIDLRTFSPGDRLMVGDVVLERSDRPHHPCATFRARTSPEAFEAVARTGLRGALFRVCRGGIVHVGDPVRKL